MASLLERAQQRLKVIYAGQKARAKKLGLELNYTAPELIAALTPLGNCVYCGEHLTPKGFQVDHTLPLARGGTFTLDNTQAVCKSCNRRKHALTHEEFTSLLKFLDALTCEGPVVGSGYAKRNILARLAAGGAWLAAKF